MTDETKLSDMKHSLQSLLKKTWARIALILFIIVLCLIAWFALRSPAQMKRDTTIAVAVAPVTQADAPLMIDALGTVNSTYTAVVTSRVDGQLMRVHFKEGQYVREGQLLAELDPRPFQAALMQAQGQLTRDTALLNNAKLDLTRYRALLEQNAISRQQVETQQALVKQYEGTVRIDQGAVKNADLQLTYSRITAPISGRVGLRQVDIGNIIHANDAKGIVSITQDAPINVVFSIAENDLTQLLDATREHASLTVAAWDRNSQTRLAEGELLAIDNQLNPETGTVTIKAKFENTDGKLFPNQFVNIKLHLGNYPQAILVPTQAIQLGKLGPTVYRVTENNSAVELVKVKTAGTSEDQTIIVSGVAPGDTVVVDGVNKLRDGSKIRIVERPTTDETASATSPTSASQPASK